MDRGDAGGYRGSAAGLGLFFCAGAGRKFHGGGGRFRAGLGAVGWSSDGGTGSIAGAGAERRGGDGRGAGTVSGIGLGQRDHGAGRIHFPTIGTGGCVPVGRRVVVGGRDPGERVGRTGALADPGRSGDGPRDLVEHTGRGGGGRAKDRGPSAGGPHRGSAVDEPDLRPDLRYPGGHDGYDVAAGVGRFPGVGLGPAHRCGRG